MVSSGVVGTPSDARVWLRPFAPNPYANLRLFCFPHAGGGALSFRPWAALFPSEIELCPIQLPGREDRFRETPYTNVDALVRALTQVLYPYELARPFALFGHSMGALIAYELAHTLEDQYGMSPVQLFVSARSAPHLPHPGPCLYTLPPDEFVAQLRMLKGTPDELLVDADPVWLQRLRADFELNEAYQPRPRTPLSVSIAAFAGRTDPRVSVADMQAWSKHTCRSFALREFESDHFFVYKDYGAVVQAILIALARAS